MQGAGHTVPSALDPSSSTIDSNSWNGNFDYVSDPDQLRGPHDDLDVLYPVDISTIFTMNMTDRSSSADVYTAGSAHSVVERAVSIYDRRAYPDSC